MNQNAQELEGQQIVFVLAQKPHAITQIKIATLCPLMNFETGEPVSAMPETFPSNGYVRWYLVPNGDWQDGELLIGKFSKLNADGSDMGGKEQYQVYGESASRTGGRVFELIAFPHSSDELHTQLRRTFKPKRVLRSDLYLECTDCVVGPFKMQSVEVPTGSKVQFEPSDKVDGKVDVYDLAEFNDLVPVVDRKIVVSPSDQPPYYNRPYAYQARFRIFRRGDLTNDLQSHREMHIIPDDLLVAKACKQIPHSKSWKKLRDELKPLVELLKDNDPPNVSMAVQEGLPRLLAEANFCDLHADALIEAVVSSDRLKERINAKVDQKVDELVSQQATQVEAKAKDRSQKAQAEANQLDLKVEQLETERQQLDKELKELKAKIDREQERANNVWENVRSKLETNREELVGEIALLAPLFASIGSNGVYSVAKPDTRHAVGSLGAERSETSEPKQQVVVDFEPDELNERQFVESRLPAILAKHGCSISPREAELFHAVMRATRLVELPHVGWGVGYAKAMGGTATISVISTAPDWLSFEQIFERFIADSWYSAINDSTRLHLVVIDGLDRCPSHAWLHPWLNVLAGWTTVLPDANRSTWPDHIRLCVTREKSEACFNVPKAIEDWILSYDPLPASSDVNHQAEAKGHLPFSSWRLNDISGNDDEFDGWGKSLEIPCDKPYFPMRLHLARRLRQAIALLRPEDDKDQCGKIVSRKLFNCWKDAGNKK